MAKKTRVYTGTQWVDLASSVTDLSQYANLNTTPVSGFRNAIINGDFKINQRGLTTSTDTGYVFDRWRWQGNATTATWTRQPFTPGNQIPGNEGTAFSRTVTNASIATDQLVNMEQRIEDVRTFAGQTVTLSFWAKAASGTPKIAITHGQNFGTGGSPSTGSTTHISQVTLSTSWTRYSVTYTVPSISGKTIGTTENTSYYSLYLIYAAGSFFNSITGSLGWQQNTFDIWGVQLEKGNIATPFEQRPIGTELALCQRYFEKRSIRGHYFNAPVGSATRQFVPVTLAVTKRVIPHTITDNGSNYYNAGSGTSIPTKTWSAHSVDSISLDADGMTNCYGFQQLSYSADAEL